MLAEKVYYVRMCAKYILFMPFLVVQARFCLPARLLVSDDVIEDFYCLYNNSHVKDV